MITEDEYRTIVIDIDQELSKHTHKRYVDHTDMDHRRISCSPDKLNSRPFNIFHTRDVRLKEKAGELVILYNLMPIINIYDFDSCAERLIILLHEFGHYKSLMNGDGIRMCKSGYIHNHNYELKQSYWVCFYEEFLAWKYAFQKLFTLKVSSKGKIAMKMFSIGLKYLYQYASGFLKMYLKK